MTDGTNVISGEETVNPQTGGSAFWISVNDWEKVEKDYKLWKVFEYVIRQLEALIRKNLAEFIGLQEFMDMLKEKVPDVYQQMQKAPADVSALTTVIKSLLKDDMPIIAFKEIVEKFTHLKKDGFDLLTITETIRSMPEICSVLPGNDYRYSYYRLGTLYEKVIDNSIDKKEIQPVLAMERKTYQNALSCVLEKVGSQKNVGLLVENAELRPFVQKLIQSELPSIPVLSRKEMLPYLEYRVSGEIELQQSR